MPLRWQTIFKLKHGVPAGKITKLVFFELYKSTEKRAYRFGRATCVIGRDKKSEER
jgi:hypothetical protein